MDKNQKRISRCISLQLIYANEISLSENSKDIISHFKNDLGELFNSTITKEQNKFSERLYKVTLENKEYVDSIIKEQLKNWDISRLALLDRLILRMASSEMLYMDEIPPKVSITEGVEIAKLFSTQDSSSFVNGILDAIYNNIYIKDNDKKVK